MTISARFLPRCGALSASPRRTAATVQTLRGNRATLVSAPRPPHLHGAAAHRHRRGQPLSPSPHLRRAAHCARPAHSDVFATTGVLQWYAHAPLPRKRGYGDTIPGTRRVSTPLLIESLSSHHVHDTGSPNPCTRDQFHLKSRGGGQTNGLRPLFAWPARTNGKKLAHPAHLRLAKPARLRSKVTYRTMLSVFCLTTHTSARAGGHGSDRRWAVKVQPG
ncbi:hypothetical protein B0H16DRAFT_1711714 [Mycena metata]|uniref:Uncharacterized protein n=1 Tax=Mycena metata TaxID=1033252 RepID=A0AAD7NWP2_9AGAR|nr:hypothetical protein B0H16DRAFT_1711714 [Mycena metata]